MTEWDGGGWSARDAKEKAEKVRNDMMNAVAHRRGQDNVVVNEGMRDEVMRRAFEELEKNPGKDAAEQTRTTMIQTIVEMRQAMGQKVDMAHVEALVDRIANDVHEEQRRAEQEKEQARVKREQKQQEKRKRKENRLAWYWWVVIAFATLPITIPLLRVVILMLGRAGRVVF